MGVRHRVYPPTFGLCQLGQPIVLFEIGLLIVQHMVSLRERPALDVLAAQANIIVFEKEGSKCKRLARGPVQFGTVFNRFKPLFQNALERTMDFEIFWVRAHRRPHPLQDTIVYSRVGHGGVLNTSLETLPVRVEHVHLGRRVPFIWSRPLERLIAQRHVLCFLRHCPRLVDHTLADKLAPVLGDDWSHSLDELVHTRLCEHGLIAFVVTETAVTHKVDYKVVVEPLPIVSRHLEDADDVLWRVGINMHNRCANHAPNVGAVLGRPRETWVSGKANLVVDDDVDRPARRVRVEVCQPEALEYNTLPSKGGVAVQKNWKDSGLRLLVGHPVFEFEEVLLGSHLAVENRIDGLEM
mmetsp:Transcript_5894/g.14976  ORF Transcript_5894/g.14976 Transcript_5894/m.14976 type:complete len:353 (-) Transcript_5894:1005-2063(-)